MFRLVCLTHTKKNLRINFFFHGGSCAALSLSSELLPGNQQILQEVIDRKKEVLMNIISMELDHRLNTYDTAFKSWCPLRCLIST